MMMVGSGSGLAPQILLSGMKFEAFSRSVQAWLGVADIFLVVALVFAVSIGDAAWAGDEVEHDDRTISIRLQGPDEIEAVRNLIETGDLDHARQNASAIEMPRYRIISLGFVAEAFAKRGEIGKAEAIAQGLTISAHRDWVLVYAVIGAVSHSSNAEITDRLLNAISGATERTRALCFVALGQLVRGQAAGAEQSTVQAAIEAQQVIAPNDAAEMSGWIAALSDELGRPLSVRKALDAQSWFGGPSPAYFIAATSSATMLNTIREARRSLD